MVLSLFFNNQKHINMKTQTTTIEKYYQSPVGGEQWTKEQWEAYVQWEELRISKDKKHDCDDCYGCDECESM